MPQDQDSQLGGPWRIVPEREGPADHSASRELVRMQLALQEGRPARIVVGSVEMQPQAPALRPDIRGQRQLCYRVKLVRELTGWKVVTERWAQDWPAGKRPRSSTLAVESLGEARAEVERLWGGAVWSALLRASSDTLKAIAPFLIPNKQGHQGQAVGVAP